LTGERRASKRDVSPAQGRRPLRAVVGFGANLGDRLSTMRAALRELSAVARVERTSHVYETAPVGPPQPEYLNAAAVLWWERTGEALLDTLLAVEGALGRLRAERFGPRTIDLDVLWVEGFCIETERLVVPHPRLRDRAFALVPMLELVPDARDPRSGERYVAPPGDVRVTDEVL
jgi:2-amino-4-hydroxy-6-hydroxymethyldihydropteridine diphosphokinase